MDIYPVVEAIEPDTLVFPANYEDFEAIDGVDIMTYPTDDAQPAITPFIHPDNGQIWQVFFEEWRAEQRLIANIRHEDPSYPDGYWIDYTTAPNAEIILKELAGRTIPLPPPPADRWTTVVSYSTYQDMTVTNPDTYYSTLKTLVGVTEEWDTFYQFENPDWPDHYFEFQTISYHPSRWPKRAYYVYWRYFRNNSEWYWSTWVPLQRYVPGILPILSVLTVLGGMLLCYGVAPSRPPRKQ